MIVDKGLIIIILVIYSSDFIPSMIINQRTPEHFRYLCIVLGQKELTAQMHKLLERQLAIAVLVYHSEGNGSIVFSQSQTAEEELVLFEIQVAGVVKVHSLQMGKE